MKQQIFALVDCNNFYVSCERVFMAEIRQHPVIVLSNNDSCVVARSNEAKALGIAMGMPLFQCQRLVEQHHIAVFSSNYALYQDLSDRVMTVLSRFTSTLEVYSIDEAWLDLSHVPAEKLETYGQEIRRRVLQETGIPVSVGIASTKVLSKVACELVKRHQVFQGVLNLFAWPEKEVDAWLAGIAVEDVWGIGKRSAEKLRPAGIVSARALKQSDHAWIRHYLNVAAQRAVLELQGVSCLPLETRKKPRQGIMVSLTFGRTIEDLRELEEAIATYATSAVEKVRRQGSRAMQVSVFIHTNPFDRRVPQYARNATAALPAASAFTPDILDLAVALLHTIYVPGYAYKKAGVFLSAFQTQEVIQTDLFGLFSQERYTMQERLMRVVDEINETWGRNTLCFGTQGMKRPWSMRQLRRSQRYTTRWSEILTVS
ncbi:Y-family DNA polymerase [Ktedonospora formicarum]|uniref:SOS mutagenesis and repair UmuC protein n=1 Tax=Ktedonospora formicarum TaxID=2778364 RepID=A0A8J3I289_9CHLR|nr:Y-family DNA polymerase [Ktedonospora formicarum]GHO48707.1 SOS mutagenesis and repair UmuC protein [Ktedonospora formicarum]